MNRGMNRRTMHNGADAARRLLTRYLGPEAATRLAARARDDCGDSCGDERPLFALFADVRHSSGLAEVLDLAGLRRFLGDFMGLAVREVEGRGGMVNKFLGDGVLALFAEDQAVSAAEAALALRQDFPALLTGPGRDHPAFGALDLALGISFGRVFLGEVGAAGRFDFTAIGQAVNVAERLAAEAPGSGVRLCGAAWKRLAAADSAGRFAASGPDMTRLRGMNRETAVHRLTWSV